MVGDDDLLEVKVSETGFADPAGIQGLLVLSTEDGRSFQMSSFSGEVAEYIRKFKHGDRTSIPSVYKMICEMADRFSLFLTKVEVFERGGVLRADLFFKGRLEEFTMRNYRASDSIALATFYDAPIMMRKELFHRLSSNI